MTTCTGYLQGNLIIMDMKAIHTESTKIAITDTFPSEGNDAPTTALTACTATANLTTWHHCLGHLHVDTVSLMLNKGMVTGMDIVVSEACAIAYVICYATPEC